MLRHEVERQRVGSIFEILPHKGVLPVFLQLKDELDGFYKRMNSQDYFFGTYLVASGVHSRLANEYHKHNQKTM